jgi:hypothetical protein
VRRLYVSDMVLARVMVHPALHTPQLLLLDPIVRDARSMVQQLKHGKCSKTQEHLHATKQAAAAGLTCSAQLLLCRVVRGQCTQAVCNCPAGGSCSFAGWPPPARPNRHGNAAGTGHTAAARVCRLRKWRNPRRLVLARFSRHGS